MKILIAEDDAVSRTILRRAVEKLGHGCLAAEDGEKAWELFQNTPEVDVVISDWMMPGMDGLELCRLVRNEEEREEYTYFIFLTALGDRDHLLMGLEAGADDYLSKPLDRDELQARLIAASRVTSLHRKLRHEIAERKQTEMELKKAEERYRTLVEQIPAVTYIQEIADPETNRTGLTMYASPQIEVQSGYPLQTFVEDPELWIKLLHPEDRQQVLAEDTRTDETGEPFSMEYRQIARDGRVVWIRDEAVLVRDEEDRPRFWQGVQFDITERKRAEKALKESELRLRSVIANVPVVLFTLNLAGEFTLSEGIGLDALGFEPGEMVGRSISELYGDRQEILDDVDRALAGEEFSVVREINARAFETWYSPLRAKTGEISGVIGVAIDITERKLAEERLQEANRHLSELASLRADFTAMVAHEIGSPLAAIRGFLDVLATGELEPAEQTVILTRIRAETDRLSTLVGDVSSAGAIESGDFTLMPRQTPVEELLKDATRFAETLPGDHPVAVEIETEEQVWADRYRIGQVLRNLLSNAAKYSPDGAPIELRAMRGKTPGRVRIEVADHGRGVHLDDAERIFEKFGRGRDQSGRKAYGVGLGLYVSRRIVRAHGGELTLDPAPVGGSVFGFDLEAVR